MDCYACDHFIDVTILKAAVVTMQNDALKRYLNHQMYGKNLW